MKRLMLLVPAAGLAAAAVIYTAVKKKKSAAPAKDEKTAQKAAVPVDLQQGSYSFVSGFKNAVTLNVTLSYDADSYSFDILDSEFPIYTSDSHVAFVSGEDFGFQLEYAAFYGDEGFAGLCSTEREKHPDAKTVTIGGIESLLYIQGDNIVFAIPADEASYILVNVIKDKGNDETLGELSEDPALLAILNTIKIEKE